MPGDATRDSGQFRPGRHPWLARLRERVLARFEVDTRSLAALRIALGSILLIDLAYRAGSIRLFYTDAGAFPRSAARAVYSQYAGLSLHALSGALWFQQTMFVVAGLFAVALIVGYRTRLVGFVSLVLLFSLHARNPAVLNGGDRLLRVLLLVALVAPLGERWSVDALRRGSARKRIVSLGTAAVLLQPVVVFTSNAILKHRGEHWYAGDALEIALHNDVMTIYLGDVLVEYPALLQVLNYVWVTLLAGSSVFLLLTVGRVRALAAVGYAGVFAGMIVTMSVGLFPLVLIASVLPFLTTPFWEMVGGRCPVDLGEWQPDASQLGPLGRPPTERRLLARLRARGRESATEFAVLYGRSLLTMAGLLVLVWMLLFAGSNVTSYDLPDELDHSHLDQQHWGLYAPDPSEYYSWYPAEAELANGSTVAPDGRAVSFDRPPDAAEEFDTFRHRKFLQDVRDAGKGEVNGPTARRYADWLCEQAATRHEGQVEQVTVYRVYQSSPLDGEFDEPKRWTVIQRDCQA